MLLCFICHACYFTGLRFNPDEWQGKPKTVIKRTGRSQCVECRQCPLRMNHKQRDWSDCWLLLQSNRLTCCLRRELKLLTCKWPWLWSSFSFYGWNCLRIIRPNVSWEILSDLNLPDEKTLSCWAGQSPEINKSIPWKPKSLSADDNASRDVVELCQNSRSFSQRSSSLKIHQRNQQFA